MVPYLHTNLLSIALPVFLLLLQTFLWQPPVIRGSLSFPEPVRPALPVSPTVRVQLLHPHQPWGLLITFVPGCCVEPVWWRNSPSFHRLIILRVCEWTSILCFFLLVFLTEGTVIFVLNLQDPLRNQNIIHTQRSVWGAEVSPDTVRNFSFSV